MATIMTHALVGYTLARICVRKPVSPLYWLLVVIAPMLPDLDVIAFKYNIPYEACWGHRGASHSIAIAFVTALILVTVFKVLTRTSGFKVLKDCFWGLFLGITSHAMLDAFTNGGLGVAIFLAYELCPLFLSDSPVTGFTDRR
jgi:inner membrane protein